MKNFGRGEAPIVEKMRQLCFYSILDLLTIIIEISSIASVQAA